MTMTVTEVGAIPAMSHREAMALAQVEASGAPMIDEMTGLQVRDHAALSPAEASAGGIFVHGTGGAELSLDAVEFCRTLSGRGAGGGLLSRQVPF